MFETVLLLLFFGGIIAVQFIEAIDNVHNKQYQDNIKRQVKKQNKIDNDYGIIEEL